MAAPGFAADETSPSSSRDRMDSGTDSTHWAGDHRSDVK
jgi:hypothetical protein